MKHIAISFVLPFMFFCTCGTNTSKNEITAEMVYESVSNYCHSFFQFFSLLWLNATSNVFVLSINLNHSQNWDTKITNMQQSTTISDLYFNVFTQINGAK